jgi:hypothetical protein
MLVVWDSIFILLKIRTAETFLWHGWRSFTFFTIRSSSAWTTPLRCAQIRLNDDLLLGPSRRGGEVDGINFAAWRRGGGGMVEILQHFAKRCGGGEGRERGQPKARVGYEVCPSPPPPYAQGQRGMPWAPSKLFGPFLTFRNWSLSLWAATWAHGGLGVWPKWAWCTIHLSHAIPPE